MPPKLVPPANLPSQGPIIYQNGQPNFEQKPKTPTDKQSFPSDKDFWRRIIELDVGLHLLIFIGLLSVGIFALMGSSKTNNFNQSVQTNPEILNQQPRIAQA